MFAADPQGGVKDFLTIGCAVLGASLGIINTVTNMNERRVKLKVIPKTAQRSGNSVFSHSGEMLPNSVLAIEIINLSAFAVTISETGFTLKGSSDRCLCPPSPASVMDNKPWPSRRLDSRESVTVYFPPFAKYPRNMNVAYAETDCGERRFGDSPALKKFRAHAQKASR